MVAARGRRAAGGDHGPAGCPDPERVFAAQGTSTGYPTSKTAPNMLTVQYAKALAADRTVAQGVGVAVRLATMADSRTGGFRQDDDGPVPWGAPTGRDSYVLVMTILPIVWPVSTRRCASRRPAAEKSSITVVAVVRTCWSSTSAATAASRFFCSIMSSVW